VGLAGASGSDVLERQVNGELIRRYDESALVPVGTHWVRAPERVRTAARQGETLDALSPPDGTVKSRRVPRAIWAGLLAAGTALLLLMLRPPNESGVQRATPTVTATATPIASPTPTPLALEAQDEIIQGGEGGREVAYPVTLQVDTGDGGAPKVWVVQRRAIQASEWRYDLNPDTASFVAGMSVRPVMGIPWSEDNAAWFARMGDGTRFALQMNTGAILRYEFASRSDVRRSDTAIFRQIAPGLALLLIGEVGEDGTPTATRPLITAAYPPEQELARDGLTVALVAEVNPPTAPAMMPPIPTETPGYAGIQVDVIRVSVGEATVSVHLRLYNGRDVALHVLPDALWLAYGYAPAPPGPRLPADGLHPFDLLPDQAADLTLTWPYAGEPYATIGVGEWRFGMVMGTQ
jgi:hypothetical protein